MSMKDKELAGKDKELTGKDKELAGKDKELAGKNKKLEKVTVLKPLNLQNLQHDLKWLKSCSKSGVF